ncbi:YrhA family protein [Franconibacter pulveris 601]|uniref:YrhA family protein n=1 Tax=Franconibacter pulveris TaxID=435910 RepID=UPI0004A3F3D0|nr:YrhA family protein [Franconibacter pulveris]
MKLDLNKMIIELKTLMINSAYQIEPPVKKEFFDSILNKSVHSTPSLILNQIAREFYFLLIKQPDYGEFLKHMDGFEYNGLRLFSISNPEPAIKNIFLINEYYRNNDIYRDPVLQERLVIGEDGMSLFTYDAKKDLFEIRDSAASESVYGEFDNFTQLLAEMIASIK